MTPSGRSTTTPCSTAAARRPSGSTPPLASATSAGSSSTCRRRPAPAQVIVERVTRDPYRILGVEPTASAEELHDAYRRLVKLHHPDRNGGSAEATRRFQEIQSAYEEIGRLRAARPAATQPRPPADDSVDARMADLEREVREAQAARQAAREAQ